MKALYLTSISTALALAILGSAASAQSSNVPREIKLSQDSNSSAQNLTQPSSFSKQAPKPSPAQPQQTRPQPQTQPAPQRQPAPQAEVSQQDLQKFANTVKKLQPIQQQAETQIMQIIQQQKLSEQRFGEIYQSRQNPQAKPTTAITPEENKRFDQAAVKIQELQKTTQSRMEKAVREEGLEIPRFNQIFIAIRSNPALLQKVQQMIQS